MSAQHRASCLPTARMRVLARTAAIASLLAMPSLSGCRTTGGDAPGPPDADQDSHAADTDCDDTIATIWYADADGDGFGAAGTDTLACGAPDGFVSDATDCDDSDGGKFPGAPEACDDGVDNDCDGGIDFGTSDLGSALGPAVATGVTVGAEDDFGASCGRGAAEDVSWSWTAPAAGTYRVSTDGSSYGTVLTARSADCASELACAYDGGADGDALTTVTVSAGERLVFVVDGEENYGSDYVLNVYSAAEANCADGVDEDGDGRLDCADGDCLPQLGGATGHGVARGTTIGAGDDVTPSCAAASGAEDVTYSWVAPDAGDYTFDTEGSDFDAVLVLSDGACSAAELACADDPDASSLTVALRLGEQVLLTVDGHDAVGGTYQLNVCDLTDDPDCDGVPDVTVDAGGSANCSVDSAGEVSCWGNRTYGQTSPPAGTFASVSVGANHVCGVDTTGAVSCWGGDDYGQSTPPAGTFASVSAGQNYTCAIGSTGSVSCWGEGSSGQSTPPSGTFVQVAAGEYHSCGVDDTGSVSCWGDDSSGQSTPPSGTFVAVGAGAWHTCALRDTGALSCWGSDGVGQSTPPSGTFVALTVGDYHNCAIDTAGTVSCWGYDGSGRATPPSGTFVAVSAGFGHTCGVEGSGALACWGNNAEGACSPPP